jgi:hypothetical protein
MVRSEATPQGFTGSGTNPSVPICVGCCVAWSLLVAFQRRKTEAIGVKAPLLGFVEPALASSNAEAPSGPLVS